jgi:hypothetical protein
MLFTIDNQRVMRIFDKQSEAVCVVFILFHFINGIINFGVKCVCVICCFCCEIIRRGPLSILAKMTNARVIFFWAKQNDKNIEGAFGYLPPR